MSPWSSVRLQSGKVEWRRPTLNRTNSGLYRRGRKQRRQRLENSDQGSLLTKESDINSPRVTFSPSSLQTAVNPKQVDAQVSKLNLYRIHCNEIGIKYIPGNSHVFNPVWVDLVGGANYTTLPGSVEVWRVIGGTTGTGRGSFVSHVPWSSS